MNNPELQKIVDSLDLSEIEATYSREKSWVWCHKPFIDNKDKNDEETIDMLALHLGFYLASWGMYRGSSFLLQKDYKVHVPIVKIIINNENDFLVYKMML